MLKTFQKGFTRAGVTLVQCSAVGGDPDEAVVGAGPEAVDVEGREAEGVDDAAADGLGGLGGPCRCVEDGGKVVGLAAEVGARSASSSCRRRG